MDLAAASELVFQAENRSPPFFRRRHVLLYSYRGDRLPCGIGRGVHFVGRWSGACLCKIPSLSPPMYPEEAASGTGHGYIRGAGGRCRGQKSNGQQWDLPLYLATI